MKRLSADTVKAVYEALRVTEKYVANKYDYVECFLPEEITFITTQELVDLYPDMSAKEREYEIVKKTRRRFPDADWRHPLQRRKTRWPRAGLR